MIVCDIHCHVHCHVHCHEETERRLKVYSLSRGSDATLCHCPLKSENVDNIVISSVIGRDVHCHVHCHEEAERRLEVYSVSLGVKVKVQGF